MHTQTAEFNSLSNTAAITETSVAAAEALTTAEVDQEFSDLLAAAEALVPAEIKEANQTVTMGKVKRGGDVAKQWS